jgi:Ca2+-binding RTX toxin-like protein
MQAAGSGPLAGLGNQAVQHRILAGQAQAARARGGAAGDAAPLVRSSTDPRADAGDLVPGVEDLGEGRALEDTVRSRMESALGEDFSRVQVHAGGEAGALAGRLGARSFAVGPHIVFGPGEYRPGTLVGDALIAHELAHVVQQEAGAKMESEAGKAESGARLEEDADLAAIGSVVSLWGVAMGGTSDVNQGASPRLRSGLRLSRCENKPAGALTQKSVTVNPTQLHGSSPNVNSNFEYANKKVYSQASVDVKKGTSQTLDEPKSKAIIGDDLVLEEYTDAAAPTAEEQALLKVNQSASAVTCYYVKEMSQGNTGEAFLPSLGQGVGFVVSNAGNDATFAHELGHVLLDSASHTVPDDTYLMYASKKADKYKLTPDQITKIRASPYVT